MRHPTLYLAAAVPMVALGIACSPEPAVEPAAELGPRLQALVNVAVAGNDIVPAAALAVEAPRLGLRWAGAAGIADPASGEPMTAAHPVRIASNTKTFVAATVLRLWERRRLGLDEAIAAHLPDELAELLVRGGYDPGAITIRQLLTHTGGIYDHSDGASYAERILTDPAHRWTRFEQVAAAIEWGQPYGAPGEVYRYSDTGYVLLGAIVEGAYGGPLPAAVRDLVGFDRLGLTSTWWETLEPRPPGVPDIAHQYAGELDGATIDASIDLYGGGGLAATMGDLARFTQGLFSGRVYAEPATLETMLAPVEGAAAGPGEPGPLTTPGVYRMGVFVTDVDGRRVFRHTGYWGTVATYDPEIGASIAATVNRHDAKDALVALERQALALLRQASASAPAEGTP